MEPFNISIIQDKQPQTYCVVDKQTGKCAYEVYLGDLLMAVFEPDENEYIHICRNPGGLDEEVIVQIAGRIETHLL